MPTSSKPSSLLADALRPSGPTGGTPVGPCPASFEVRSPFDGHVVTTVPDVDAEAAHRAAEDATQAFPRWRIVPVRERAEILDRWADLIDQATDELADLIVAEMGKPIQEARREVAYTSGFARSHALDALRADGHLLPGRDADQRVEVSYRPVGPAFGITPWNFPAAMVTRTAAPALAAGCTMVLKPAEATPATALVLAELWRRAGGPPTAFQVLPCERPQAVGAAVLGHPGIRKLTFTGSHAIGVRLYQQAAERMLRVSMELGGHAPFLVLDDVDVDQAADEIMRSKFRINGQTCVCVNRVLVDERIATRLLDALRDRVLALRTGDPRDETTDVGPLINRAGLDKVSAHVEDARQRGANVLVGGSIEHGLVYAPTLVAAASDDMRLMREETFGPVLPVATFSTIDEAVTRANDSPFGLAAYVATRDLGRAHRVAEQLDAGIIGVNDGVPGGDPSVPFGGMKESGVGRAGGRWGLHAYLEPQYRSLVLP